MLMKQGSVRCTGKRHGEVGRFGEVEQIVNGATDIDQRKSFRELRMASALETQAREGPDQKRDEGEQDERRQDQKD